MSSFLLISPEAHFSEVLQEAQSVHRVKSMPLLDTYIIKLLMHYLNSKNLFQPIQSQFETDEQPPDTFAEMYLTAMNSEGVRKIEIMRALAERSLYLTGYFSESLSNKLVDRDYFCDIGQAGYTNLASWSRESELQTIYSTLSSKFKEYVLVLNYISEKSAVQSDNNVISLYEKYIKTGSKIAREKLTQLGVNTPSKEQLKVHKA